MYMYTNIRRLGLVTIGLAAAVGFAMTHLHRPVVPAAPPDPDPGAHRATASRERTMRLPIAVPPLPAVSHPPDLVVEAEESPPPEVARHDAEGLARAELERLNEAVKLTEDQRPRAAKVVRAVCHLRTLVSHHPAASPTAEARRLQIDRQERLALLAVLRPEQEPLLDIYLSRR